jgi:hypothetical protein
MQNSEYFAMHLYNKVQDKYDLDNNELNQLINFVENMYDGDKKSGIKLFLKHYNDQQFKNMVSQVINRDIDKGMSNSFDYNSGHLAAPMGFPLTM